MRARKFSHTLEEPIRIEPDVTYSAGFEVEAGKIVRVGITAQPRPRPQRELDITWTEDARRLLVRDARDLIARYEEELAGTWLDGMLSMLRRLAEVVEEDGDA